MKFIRVLLALVPLVLCTSALIAQNLGPAPAGENVLYGDLKIKEDANSPARTGSFEVVLYLMGNNVVARQTVSANGRYRFNNLLEGDYDIAVMFENSEITRLRVLLRAPVYKTDIRQDIELEWKTVNNPPARAASVSAEDYYKRSAPNQKLFDKAQESTDKKKYSDSIVFLKQLVAADPNDFQAWTELGTVYLLSKDLAEAEKAYEQSTNIRPTFFLALMNLGRLRMMLQKYDTAIPVLTRAVEVKASSADANYYLGEAYLQIKKGSKAVNYLYEALKLDPVGKAEAHLRLAALYNGAGLKDKAAVEYEEFLKKKPDYPERKKLEQYIAANKK